MDISAKTEAIAGIVMILVAAIFFVATGNIYEDPNDPGFSAQDFPRGVVILIGILGAVLFLVSLRSIEKEDWFSIPYNDLMLLVKYVAPIAILGFVYINLIELAQYLLPTILVTSAALALFGNRGVIRLIVIPIVGGLAYYTLFFGVLGLFEAPGSLISYENTAYFQPLRDLFGL